MIGEPPSERPSASDFHKRAGESHAEARKLLTGLAAASLGVFYASLTGRQEAALPPSVRRLAFLAVVFMTLAVACGLAAWRADAAWSYRAAANFLQNPGLTKPDGGVWHPVKVWSDRLQLVFFAAGLIVVALLTLQLL